MITVPRWLLLALGALFSGVPRRARHLLARRPALAVADRSSRWCSTRSRRPRACGRRKRVRMPDWLAGVRPRREHRAAAARDEPARSRRRQRLRDLVRRGGRHADDDRGGPAAARGRLARRHRARGADASSGPGRSRSARWASIGSIVWVAIAHMLTTALDDRRPRDPPLRAGRARGRGLAGGPGRPPLRGPDAARPDEPHRGADAAAHRRPRRRRSPTTQRRECRMLEAAIRDEIRGRMLLTDAVRAEVQRARERGIDRDAARRGRHRRPRRADQRDRVLSRLAEAVAALERRPDHRPHRRGGLAGRGDGRRPARARRRSRQSREHRRPRGRVLARDPARRRRRARA